MKAIVVYESLWGNTAAIARAIAEGLGPEARALSTAEATAAEIAGAGLIVAGAPVMAFSLPTEQIRQNQARNPGKAPPPDMSHPSMRAWLGALPAAQGRFAAFETAFRWSPGGATGGITRGMEHAGYRQVAKRQRFIVTKGGREALRPGEVEKARAWGAELARTTG
jgi:hypothetical protein